MSYKMTSHYTANAFGWRQTSTTDMADHSEVVATPSPVFCFVFFWLNLISKISNSIYYSVKHTLHIVQCGLVEWFGIQKTGADICSLLHDLLTTITSTPQLSNVCKCTVCVVQTGDYCPKLYIHMQFKLANGFAVFSGSTHLIPSGNRCPKVSSRKLPYHPSV